MQESSDMAAFQAQVYLIAQQVPSGRVTTYGQIGIKVWIYKGEILPEAEESAESTEGVYVS